MNGRGCVRFIPIEANINRENACASSLFFLIHSFSIFSNASQINCFSVEGRLLKKSSPVHGGIGSSPTKHVCNSAHGFGVGFPSCLAINAWHKFTLLNGCCFFLFTSHAGTCKRGRPHPSSMGCSPTRPRHRRGHSREHMQPVWAAYGTSGLAFSVRPPTFLSNPNLKLDRRCHPCDGSAHGR